MTSRPKAGRTPVRRQAESNYLDVDQETALHRLESFHAAARGPFELLQSKFGFQTSSVANQKENLGCWITNYQMRIRAESLEGVTESSDFVTRTALRRVHNKFFKNYLMWCKFLRTPPRACDTEKDTTLKMEKELALFLLLWGEAGNLRFMPECICFLYHSMAAKLEYLETLPDVEEGFYLDKIVRPMYYVIAKMRSATAPPDKRPLDHQDTTNYDDVNEFFWTPKCLACDERNVAKLLEVHDPKTFKEKRSVFNPILAFFRVWYFLVVVFHVMVVITYVAYMAEGDNDGGLGFFFRIFTTNQNKIRAHALYSIFMTVTGLLAMKVVLQIWLFGLRLYTDVWMAVGVFCRLIWHTLFFGLFVAIHFSPDGSAVLGSWSTILPGGGTAGSFLSMGLLYLAVYSIPVLLAALIRAFFPNAIWGIRIVSALDGTSRLYVGRHTAQPWKHYSRYSLSWFLIFLCKFLFALQFMIRPLMPPSIEIYDLSVNDNGVFKSGHNILFIAALWAPVVVVYLYDTQIWFIIYQSLIGLIMGKRMRIGHYVGLAQLKQGMARAPHLFDEKVVSQKTRQPHREERAPGTGDPTDAGDFRHRDVVRLRFAIIWNQVVENFRLNDLVDDREVMILQYRIIHHGDRVQEPIFLLAGKLAKGIEIASKARGHKWDTSTVIKQLATADALEGVRDGAELVRELFYLLLDEPDSDEPSGQRVLEYIYSSPDVVSLVDCTLLPTLADKVVEFLAAILDMPEDFSTLASLSDMPPELGMEVHVQVAQVVERVRDIACTLENMIHDDAVATKLHACRFLHATPDLAFQTQLLFALYQADAAAETGLIAVHRHDLARPPASATSRPFAPHDFLSSCTRLFFLLRLEVASSLPRCEDAKRRMGFFLHSLAMDMPRVPAMDAMPSFSVLTPYYSETVLFSLDELNNPVHANPLFSALEQKQKAKGWTELTIMKYLITFHAEEWSNFLERMGVAQINAFEAKLSNGCAESCLSREGHRLTHALDFPRLNSMFYGHFGFYICNALTVLCVYVYAYCKLYIATHTEVQVLAISSSGSLDALASVLTTQYLLQFGMLTTLPLFATLFVEFGLKQALLKVLELLSTLGIVFYVFLTGTKAHFYDVALLRGGSKYRGTGRGFSITRDPMVNFFKEYGVSHFRKAVELIGVMILFGIYGTFDLGSGALAAYCKTATFDCDTHPDQIPARITALAAYSRQSQSFGLAAFAVLFLGACWLLAPFIFNTDGLVWQKTKVDIAHWFTWMMRSRDQADERSGEDAEPAKRDVVSDGWDDWWQSDVELMVPLGWMGRLTYCLREVRHPLAMYYIFLTEFTLPWFALLAAAMGVTWIVLWSGARVRHCVSSHDRRLRSGAVLGLLYMVTVVGGIFVVPLIAGVVCGWSVLKCFTFSVAMLLGFSALVQYALALHGAWGTRLATSGPIVALGFLLDMIVGLFLVVPLFLLSLLPFMRILQTRAMYNGGFSRALSSGSEVAASLCILLGLLAGFVHGFVTSFVATLGFINDSRDAFFNRSFYYFVTTALPQDGDEMVSYMKKGYIQATGAGMSIVAVVLSLGIGRVLGRRWNMALGATLVLVSLGLNFVSHTYVLLVSFGLAAMGAAMLAMNYLLYSYEICTKGWRGKSVTIFLLGSMLGWCIFSLIMANANATTISANFKNEPTSTWRVQPLFFVPALVLGLFGILWFVPESPVWLLAHQRDDAAQAVLVRLRRRQNVAPELALVHAELKQSTRKQHVVFRLSLVFALQATFGLVMSHAILVRRPLQLTDASRGAANNYWQVYFALCCATGFAFGSFLVDNVRRKTILKEFLPFVALVAFTCGIVAAVSEADGSLVQALLCLLYISAGLSLMSVTWLTALEMFPASRRPLYWTLSLSVYYGVELLVYLLKPSFALASFVLAGACGLLTVVLFVFCASTKLGAIQTKSEKKFQRSRPDTEREDAHRTTAQDVVVDDVHEQQRRIAQSATRSAGGAYNPVSSAIHVDGGGSARGKTRGPPLSRQDRAAPRDESGADKTTGECSFRRLESLDEDAAPEDVAPAAPPRALQYGLSTGLSQSHVSSGEVASNTQRSARQGLLPSHLSSTFDFEAEFEEEHLEELRQGQISYPRGQPRSVSFLQSREYPDAQVHAETRARRL
ncbi:hypothetical protein PsorP6_017083 [Peronosclerospora sorghi]|uniref:Uncharacterized protein n=1 Tax=Peronosclerospora sorghi TaxID=230839 RepID=A0ACC0WDK9_9STRA|nr:hypothetical protein PsorP6_017083 [Peronosclerospora sorghi]